MDMCCVCGSVAEIRMYSLANLYCKKCLTCKKCKEFDSDKDLVNIMLTGYHKECENKDDK